MRITIRTEYFPWPLVIPLPLGLVGVVVHVLPERIFASARANLPEACGTYVTKPMLREIFWVSRNILREYEGLEILSVMSSDGESVTITL